ncbi:hypothetical protein AURDEDRAFT_174988 [Auricularia subglabra TFB-10046 SS5]|nr:hypothetical protein AURDEDRAFT_174988 [Auricularia subglabra TFB-10046 SS5]
MFSVGSIVISTTLIFSGMVYLTLFVAHRDDLRGDLYEAVILLSLPSALFMWSLALMVVVASISFAADNWRWAAGVPARRLF